jgi:hypothetical protein
MGLAAAKWCREAPALSARRQEQQVLLKVQVQVQRLQLPA